MSDLDLGLNEAEDSTYVNDKRGHSPSTKQRLAEHNAQHYNLQKQRGKELKGMIPEAFLEKTQNDQGSNRELMHTMNATKLYIASLLEDKKELQEEVDKYQNRSMDVDKSCDKVEEVAPGGRLLRSHTILRSDINMGASGQATVKAMGAVDLSRLDGEHGRASGRWPEANDEDGTLPETPTPDISPHDSLLRQAVEKFIALIKESVTASQGVLDKKQINRLNTVHDCIVEMVEDMRKR